MTEWKRSPFFTKKVLVVSAAAAAALVFAGGVAVQWRKGKSLSALRAAALGTVFSVAGGKGRDSVTEEGVGITRVRTREGKTVFDLKGERVLQFLGGVQTLEGVAAVLHGEGGGMRVSSDEADYDSRSGNITLRGHVFLRDPHGLEIRTEKVVYSDKTGEAKSEAPVAFARGGLRGRALTMRYRMQTGGVVLEGGVDVDAREPASADNGGGSHIVLRAERVEYARRGESLRLFGADDAAPLPTPDAPPEEHERWKSACVRVESLPTLNDARLYRMWALAMTAKFNGEVLEDMETLGATLVEVSDTLRPADPPSAIRSDHLAAFYDAAKQAFRLFDFTGRVSLRHADMTAYADRLLYDAPARKADLEGNAEAVSRAYILRSETMAFFEEERRLEGHGTVQAVARHGEDMRFPLPGEEPVHVYAREVTMWQAEERAEFRGAAVARRGEDTISAATLVFMTKEGVLEAHEQVATILMSVGSETDVETDEKKKREKKGKGPTRLPTLIGAKSLRYEDAARLAVYRGGAHLSRQDVSVRGEEIHAFFTQPKGGRAEDEEEKAAVERVVARRDVTVESPGRVGRGDWAEYNFLKSEATLGGERDIEVRELATGRVARGRILTYGVNEETLGIYTDSLGRTVSTSQGGGVPPAPTGAVGAPPSAQPPAQPMGVFP